MRKAASALKRLCSTMNNLPYWAKQSLYVNLKDDLSKDINIEWLNRRSSEDLIQNYVPKPSALTKMYINRKFNKYAVKMDLTENETKFLKCLENNNSILEISNENEWSLAETCNTLAKCLDKNLIEPINNNYIANTILFIGGKIRFGEYLIRLNKLSLSQLDNALYAQSQIKKQSDDDVKIGDLLVNLGHIKDSEKQEVLNLKDTSSKVLSLEDETDNLKLEIQSMKEKINLLTFENEGIREDLSHYQKELIDKTKQISELKTELDKHKSFKHRLATFFGFNDSYHSLINP